MADRGRSRRRRSRFRAGPEVIFAVLLLILAALLIRRVSVHHRQDPETETVAAEPQETAAPETTAARETAVQETTAAREITVQTETEPQQRESPEETEPQIPESTAAEETRDVLETPEETTEAHEEETRPPRRVSDYGVGQPVDGEVLSELGTAAFFTQSEIPDSVRSRMYGKSFRENGNIELSELRYLRVLYYDYGGTRRVGELVSSRLISEDLLEIFRDLYEAEYPIAKMRLVDDYDASDDRSCEDNNTSCFNYRTVAGSDALSRHAFGLAIDINPLENPMVYYDEEGNITRCIPWNGEEYADRERDFTHKMDREDLCVRLFTEHGFIWGGEWGTPDYMHFVKNAGDGDG